jgi:hypothetical protein
MAPAGGRNFPQHGGDSPSLESAERFPGIIFENPPFILEKRRILLQGSLSV